MEIFKIYFSTNEFPRDNPVGLGAFAFQMDEEVHFNLNLYE